MFQFAVYIFLAPSVATSTNLRCGVNQQLTKQNKTIMTKKGASSLLRRRPRPRGRRSFVFIG